MASARRRRHHHRPSIFPSPSGPGTARWPPSAAMRRLWKPSGQTPLCAIATIKIAERVCRDNGVDPAHFQPGHRRARRRRRKNGPRQAASAHFRHRLDPHGPRRRRKSAAPPWPRAARTGRQQRHHRRRLGANLDLATRAIFFGAVGTAGQRCTTTRRVFVHRSIEKRTDASGSSPPTSRCAIGNPLDARHSDGAADQRRAPSTPCRRRCGALREEGGKILYGGKPLTGAEISGRPLRRRLPGQGRAGFQNRPGGNLRAHSLSDSLSRKWRRPSPGTTPCRRA